MPRPLRNFLIREPTKRSIGLPLPWFSFSHILALKRYLAMIHCIKTRPPPGMRSARVLSCNARVWKHQSLSDALAFIAKPFVIGVIARLADPNIQVP